MSTDEYVTTRQVKYLFSRWSKEYREGKLKNPIPDDAEDLYSNEEVDEHIDNKDIYNDDHYEEVQQVMQQLSLCINDWVAVRSDGKWYPGTVTEEIENGLIIKTMIWTTYGKNRFKWPMKDNILTCVTYDILCTVKPPEKISHRFYCLCEDDFIKATKAYEE